ncbi:primase C-terminal domain-containing protein, partial [Guyparkeria sp. 1SP6A2]|nr:primase C-terminal domain-containing protein [Guyparkeria sp. 1SP6A2]
EFQKLESLDNLERWFAQRISEGNRNNNMLKYAMALKDSGMLYTDAEKQVREFNRKLSNPLSDDELGSTIFRTLASKYDSSRI